MPDKILNLDTQNGSDFTENRQTATLVFQDDYEDPEDEDFERIKEPESGVPITEEVDDPVEMIDKFQNQPNRLNRINTQQNV